MTPIPTTMRAMLLEAPGAPLRLAQVPVPRPGRGQVLLQVRACGVCRTDLHIRDGELPNPKLSLILGHEIVGTVVESGPDAGRFNLGERVGVPWLGWTDDTCRFCRREQENLCDNARFTGYTLDGGYAEYTVADERYCFRLPPEYPDAEVAPLLCAGLIGYRTLRLAGFMIDEQQQLAHGYDHAYLLDSECHNMASAAASAVSGDGRLIMDLYTTKPALQFYTGNHLSGTPSRDGNCYAAHQGLALETQFLPDSPNHPEWPQPDCWLRPGEIYRHTTVLVFRGG